MTKEQFLSAMGDIDDKFLKEIAHTSDEISEWDPDSEKPQILRPERRPVPLWRTAVFTAAAVCVLTAGIFGVFGISRLHGIHSAGSSPEVSLNSAGSVDLSNGSDTLDDKLNSALNEIDKLAKLNSVIVNGHEFNTIRVDPESDVVHTDPVIVTDDSNFATLYIAFQNTSEHFTMNIMVDRKDYLEEGKYKLTHLGEIIVSENKEGTCLIDYTEKATAGDELVLGFYTSNYHITVEGKWLP